MVSVHADGECRIRYVEIEMAEECFWNVKRNIKRIIHFL